MTRRVEQETADHKPDGSAWKCANCHTEVVPYERRDEKQLGFDPIHALNVLLRKFHDEAACARNYDEAAPSAERPSSREAALREAHDVLLGYKLLFGPELVAARAWRRAVEKTTHLLTTFLAGAKSWRTLEAGREARTLNERRIGSAQTQRVIEQTTLLLEKIDRLDLPNTNTGKGRPKKHALGHAETILRDGGFTFAEIAELDLDGAGDGKANRVQQRVAAYQRQLPQWLSAALEAGEE